MPIEVALSKLPASLSSSALAAEKTSGSKLPTLRTPQEQLLALQRIFADAEVQTIYLTNPTELSYLRDKFTALSRTGFLDSIPSEASGAWTKINGSNLSSLPRRIFDQLEENLTSVRGRQARWGSREGDEQVNFGDAPISLRLLVTWALTLRQVSPHKSVATLDSAAMKTFAKVVADQELDLIKEFSSLSDTGLISFKEFLKSKQRLSPGLRNDLFGAIENDASAELDSKINRLIASAESLLPVLLRSHPETAILVKVKQRTITAKSARGRNTDCLEPSKSWHDDLTTSTRQATIRGLTAALKECTNTEFAALLSQHSRKLTEFSAQELKPLLPYFASFLAVSVSGENQPALLCKGTRVAILSLLHTKDIFNQQLIQSAQSFLRNWSTIENRAEVDSLNPTFLAYMRYLAAALKTKWGREPELRESIKESLFSLCSVFKRPVVVSSTLYELVEGNVEGTDQKLPDLFAGIEWKNFDLRCGTPVEASERSRRLGIGMAATKLLEKGLLRPQHQTEMQNAIFKFIIETDQKKWSSFASGSDPAWFREKRVFAVSILEALKPPAEMIESIRVPSDPSAPPLAFV